MKTLIAILILSACLSAQGVRQGKQGAWDDRPARCEATVEEYRCADCGTFQVYRCGADGRSWNQIAQRNEAGATSLIPYADTRTAGERVANGDFSSGLTGWTISGDGAGWAVVGGKLVHTPGSTNKISRAMSISANEPSYVLQANVYSMSAGSRARDRGI